MKAFLFRNLSLNKKFYLLVLLGSLSFYLLAFNLYKKPVKLNIKVTLPVDIVQCSREPQDSSRRSFPKYDKQAQKHSNDKRILVITDKLKKSFSKKILILLDSLKLKYRVSDTVKHLLKFYHTGKDAYSVIIFEKLSTYSKLSSIDFNILKKYCKKFNIGIIGFILNEEDINVFKKQGLTGIINKVNNNYHINNQSPLLRITKGGTLPLVPYITSHLQSNCTLFLSNHTTYDPVTFTHSAHCSIPSPHCILSPIVIDKGLIDGIDKVIFGTDFHFWLHTLIFLDALYLQSRGDLHLPLERHILVDIDDVFVGRQSTRFTRPDVMVTTYEYL